MGGSGGDEPTGRANGGETNSCDLKIDTTLYSPVQGVADHLKTGEILSVTLTGERPTVVGVFTRTNERTGTIARAENLAQLIYCLQHGNEFLAEVISANGSDIRIQVRNV